MPVPIVALAVCCGVPIVLAGAAWVAHKWGGEKAGASPTGWKSPERAKEGADTAVRNDTDLRDSLNKQ